VADTEVTNAKTLLHLADEAVKKTAKESTKQHRQSQAQQRLAKKSSATVVPWRGSTTKLLQSKKMLSRRHMKPPKP
jgi:hypothetical protein